MEIEWISVKDRLPETNGDKSGMIFIGCIDYYATDETPHWQHASTGLYVTHWMPLPEPPGMENRIELYYHLEDVEQWFILG